MQFNVDDLLSCNREALRSQLVRTHIKILMALESVDAPLQYRLKRIAFNCLCFR